MGRLYYLYGIIQENLEISESMGIDGRNPLFLVEDESLQAVVSYVENGEFSAEVLSQKAEDLFWLQEKATRHMEIIRLLHERSTVIIPVKFCTVFTGEEGILNMLKEKRFEYLSLMKKLQGLDEYGVKVYINERSFLPHELEEIRSDMERLVAGAGKGKAYMIKKNMESTLQSRKEELVVIYRERIWKVLLGLNFTGKMNKTLSGELTGKKERMILNGVFLVPRVEGLEFMNRADSSLKEQLVPGLTIEWSGPWPPYNFCS